MTGEDHTILNDFETKLRHFIYLQQELKKENQTLCQTLLEKENEILRLSQENLILKEKYSRLKAAKTMDVSANDIKDTKSRLSKLVREIDKCIALLNE